MAIDFDDEEFDEIDFGNGEDEDGDQKLLDMLDLSEFPQPDADTIWLSDEHLQFRADELSKGFYPQTTDDWLTLREDFDDVELLRDYGGYDASIALYTAAFDAVRDEVDAREGEPTVSLDRVDWLDARGRQHVPNWDSRVRVRRRDLDTKELSEVPFDDMLAWKQEHNKAWALSDDVMYSNKVATEWEQYQETTLDALHDAEQKGVYALTAREACVRDGISPQEAVTTLPAYKAVAYGNGRSFNELMADAYQAEADALRQQHDGLESLFERVQKSQAALDKASDGHARVPEDLIKNGYTTYCDEHPLTSSVALFRASGLPDFTKQSSAYPQAEAVVAADKKHELPSDFPDISQPDSDQPQLGM